MKFAIVGDCHLGVKSGSSHFAKYQIRFFNEQLFPYMEQHGIDTIIQTGDLWDHRTQLQLKSYHPVKKHIFDEMQKRNIKFHTLVGNHDMQLRESVKLNTSEILLREYSNVTVYSHPTAVAFDDITVDIVPWICNENGEEIREFMTRKIVGDICIGHFEIVGGMMQKGIPGHGGMPTKLFERYSSVKVGHYHSRNFLNDGQIEYVGTPYPMNWGDCNDQRGFNIFDTKTLTTEFIPNPEEMFIKLRYDNVCYTNPKSITGKYVKLIVDNKKNLVDFDNYLNSLKLADPHDLIIIDNKIDLSGGDIEESVEVQNTETIINQYIDGMTDNIDKDSVKHYVQSLLQEANNR
jgi:DNA repair exonuclease SbcCD nuclease subunit